MPCDAKTFVRPARALCAAAFLLAASVALAVDVADPGTFVVDEAHVLDPETREKLEALLKQLEQKTTDQIKLLTVPSLEGEDIFTFSQRHAERWRLGRKGKDNGALIVFALKDRHVRIHTYYGLEGALPDAWIGTLSRHIAQEYFRQGKYSQGLDEMVRAVVQRVADEEGVTLEGARPPRFMPPAPLFRPLPIGFFICAVVLLVFVIPLLFAWLRRRRPRPPRRRRRRRSYWDWGEVFTPPAGPWGPWSGGGHGGGFGSGGFGGGFGGGGGSFGGGGHSGGGGGGASW